MHANGSAYLAATHEKSFVATDSQNDSYARANRETNPGRCGEGTNSRADAAAIADSYCHEYGSNTDCCSCSDTKSTDDVTATHTVATGNAGPATGSPSATSHTDQLSDTTTRSGTDVSPDPTLAATAECAAHHAFSRSTCSRLF